MLNLFNKILSVRIKTICGKICCLREETVTRLSVVILAAYRQSTEVGGMPL